MTSKDVRYYFVGNYTGATGLGGGETLSAYDDLSDGEMAVVNVDNVVMNSSNVGSNSLADQHGVRIAFRSGSNLYFTPYMKSGNVLAYDGVSTSAEQEQITYIGYNGSGNSIDTIANNVYVPRIDFWNEGRQGFNTPYVKTTAYKSGDNPTQLNVAINIANGLQASFNQGRLIGQDKAVKTEVVSSASGAALSGTTGDITVTKGSQWISAASDIDGEMSVGDLWRAGDTTSDPVYKILSFDTSNDNAKIDRPFEGDSQTFTASSTDYITASNAASADFGVKLTGIARKFTDPKKHHYEKVKFDVGLDGWGNTEVTYDQAAQLGIGVYEDVAEAEYLYQGNEGNPYRGDFMHTTARKDATEGNTYNLLTMRFYNDQETSSVSYVRSPMEITLAFKSGYVSGQAPDVVINALDTFTGITSGISA